MSVAAAAGLILSGLTATAATAATSTVTPTEAVEASAVDSGIVRAAPVVGFDPGTIIDDALFFDGGAMSAAEIQSFLDQKNRCTNGRCLNTSTASISSRAAVVSHRTGNLVCNAVEGGTMRTSELIYRMQVACGISAKVILVTLEKEQSLVTGRTPSERNFTYAMGANCPDTAPCDPNHSGIGPQILAGVTSLKNYSAGRFSRQPGVHWIGYSPNANCGGTNVNVTNFATAALYNYTPYQPNASALAAGYGLGDDCGSYGNRNFYNFYKDWFGAVRNSSPFGGYNLETQRGQVTVLGWTLDPDERSTALEVSVSVDGQEGYSVFRADDDRPDVGAAHPGYGNRHGIRKTFQVVGGDHTICVTVRNVGAGADTQFGCTTVWVETASPYGGVSVQELPGGVRVTGWTLDRDTTAPLDVHVYVDGKGASYRADVSRPDVGAAFPGLGNNHGVDVSIQTSVGQRNICAYGINVGLGFNKLLGCVTVNVTQSADPVGGVDDIYAVPGGFFIRGWTADPNSANPLNVHIYGGTTTRVLTTSVARDDVASRISFAPRASGFETRVDASAGDKNVCAYGINVGWGKNSTLACRSVRVMSGQPFGGIDTTVSGTSVRVRGWTIDPDVTEPIAVHLYIDGVGTAITANVDRPDVRAAYPGYGAVHGIDTTVELAPGRHQICAYGINVGAGANSSLGCRTVDIESRSPFGGTDVTVEANNVRLRGWVIDPDTTAPVAVHVYVDGVGAAVVNANVSRPDVARVYPSSGPDHGIDVQLRMSAGTHQVCSYGINVGAGSNALLGCHTVDVPG